MFRQCNIQDDKYAKVLPLDLGCEDCRKGHSFGPAVRMYWLLHYVITGKGTYTVNNRTYEVSAGQAFLIKPGEITVYTADKEEPWEYVWASFDSDVEALNGLPYIIDMPEIRNIFLKIYNEYDFSSDDQVYAIARIWEIFGVLSKNSLNSNGTGYVKRAIDIIKNQYMHDISIKTIADQLNIDRSYFSNIFKKATGVSPSQYLINYRMYKALYLLRCEKYSVSVVATSVGYSDLFSFSRSFKKLFGVPPQRYKEIKSPNPSFTFKLSDDSNI